MRISSELKGELKKLAQSMRPRTAIQYLIEDAIEQYLSRIAENKGASYSVKTPETELKTDKNAD